MKLVYEASGEEVAKGDIVTVRGKEYVVDAIEKPRHAGSTGRVYIKGTNTESASIAGSFGYYPSVIKARWIEREDQA